MPRCEACGGGGKGAARGKDEAAAALADEAYKRIGDRVARFICRAALLLLWLYCYGSMKGYVTKRIDENTWFCKFVVITVAVPMADVFIIIASFLLD